MKAAHLFRPKQPPPWQSVNLHPVARCVSTFSELYAVGYRLLHSAERGDVRFNTTERYVHWWNLHLYRYSNRYRYSDTDFKSVLRDGTHHTHNTHTINTTHTTHTHTHTYHTHHTHTIHTTHTHHKHHTYTHTHHVTSTIHTTHHTHTTHTPLTPHTPHAPYTPYTPSGLL